MKTLKSLFAAPGTAVRNAGIAFSGAVMASPSFAAIDTAAIEAGVLANTAKGEEVGGYVILAVLAFAVVGIIIGMVRKA